MPPPPDLSSYVLSDEDSTEIFNTCILPDEFTNLQPSPHVTHLSQPPVAVLIVGQTGAGKTRFAPPILRALTSTRGNGTQPPAHFIADTYKTYHPSYNTLASSQETAHLASPATGPDARRWLLKAALYAASLRLDVLLESACRHPDDFIQLASAFHEAGYRVEVLLLAVPSALSRLGILTRFYEKLPEAGSRGLPVRLTPVKVHDDSYRGLEAAAAWIDENGHKVDQVIVVRRDALVAFSDSKKRDSDSMMGDDGDGGLSGLVADAVRRERGRPLTSTERGIAEGDLRKLRDKDEVLAKEIKAMLEPLLANSQDGQQASLPDLRPLELPPDGQDEGVTLMLGSQ